MYVFIHSFIHSFILMFSSLADWWWPWELAWLQIPMVC